MVTDSQLLDTEAIYGGLLGLGADALAKLAQEGVI